MNATLSLSPPFPRITIIIKPTLLLLKSPTLTIRFPLLPPLCLVHPSMKMLCRRGAVHPSPPLISDHLAFLPAAILSLTAALAPEDREVLAYLLSCSGAPASGSSPGHRKAAARKHAGGGGGDHSPYFNCSCFGCYTNYWARWDASPNRQLIHEIIDSFEDWLVRSRNPRSRRERRKRGFHAESESGGVNRPDLGSGRGKLLVAESESKADAPAAGDDEDKGSVRKLVSLIGERIWNVWGQ